MRCPHEGMPPAYQRAATAMYCKGQLAAVEIGCQLWSADQMQGSSRRVTSCAQMLLGRMKARGIVARGRRGWVLTRFGMRIGRAHELCVRR